MIIEQNYTISLMSIKLHGRQLDIFCQSKVVYNLFRIEAKDVFYIKNIPDLGIKNHETTSLIKV